MVLANRKERAGGTPNQEADDSITEVTPEREGDQQLTRSRAGRESDSPAGISTTSREVMKELEAMRIKFKQLEEKSNMVQAMTSNADALKELVHMGKRDRDSVEKKKERPDKPVLVVWSEMGEQAVDNNHDVFAWAARRQYRQPNSEPCKYWDDAKYVLEVKPNLREGLYLTHLMPLGLSAKALSWGHDLVATVAVRYFTHSQAMQGAKKKRSNIVIEEDEEKMQSRVMSMAQEWAEVSGLTEIMEAVFNWSSVRFMTAPWDWSGILLLRVLHDVSFFTHASDSEDSQKAVAEKFIDEFLTQNRRRLMSGKPPLIYRKALLLAQDVVRTHNGRQDSLFNKASVYSSHRLAERYKSERDKAWEELKAVRAERNALQKKVKTQDDRGTLDNRQRGNFRDREQPRYTRPGRAEWESDKEYKEDRMEVCRAWNDKGCSFGTGCSKKHVCNARSSPGKCCKSKGHRGPEHK